MLTFAARNHVGHQQQKGRYRVLLRRSSIEQVSVPSKVSSCPRPTAFKKARCILLLDLVHSHLDFHFQIAYYILPLISTRPGESEVEQIAERIEQRREQRVPITFGSRVRFLKHCRKICLAKNYEEAKVSLEDLKEYRSKVEAEVANLGFRSIAKVFAIRLDSHCLLDLLDRAVELTKEDSDGWLHYKDFNFFHTKVESRWPIFRTEMRAALLLTFLYFFMTPILFCNIMDDSGICESDGDPYLGWVSR